MNAPSRPAIVVARDIEQALKDKAECAPEVRRLLVEAANVLSKIPNHRELIPQAATFSVAEVAVWLNRMPYGEPVKSKTYNAATEWVRGLIKRKELPARATGGKSYSVSGFALREYMERRDEPIRARDAA